MVDNFRRLPQTDSRLFGNINRDISEVETELTPEYFHFFVAIATITFGTVMKLRPNELLNPVSNESI